MLWGLGSFLEKWINEILWFFMTFLRFNDIFHKCMTKEQILWLFKISWTLADLWWMRPQWKVWRLFQQFLQVACHVTLRSKEQFNVNLKFTVYSSLLHISLHVFFTYIYFYIFTITGPESIDEEVVSTKIRRSVIWQYNPKDGLMRFTMTQCTSLQNLCKVDYIANKHHWLLERLKDISLC